MSKRPLWKRVWYGFVHFVFRLATTVFYSIRCEGRDRLPPTGGTLLLPNHQSYLDPILAGLACDRRLNFLARDDLFRFPLFGGLLRSFDSIPVSREGRGVSGLRETLRRLQLGEAVLIFPEGTRTTDGEIGPLQQGFCLAARRARVPLAPLAIEGAFDAWPRNSKFPKPGLIRMQFAEPILPSEYESMSNEQLLDEVSRRLCEALESARGARNRARSSMIRTDVGSGQATVR